MKFVVVRCVCSMDNLMKNEQQTKNTSIKQFFGAPKASINFVFYFHCCSNKTRW